jgi:hypothetical protein
MRSGQSGPDLKLNGYSSPHVRTLYGWDIYSARNTLRGRLRDDVKQNFTHFARPRPNGIALFVSQSVDQPICVKGKNHWFSVHCFSQSPSFTRVRKADPVFYSGASLEYGDGAQSRSGSIKPPHSKEASVSIVYRDLRRFLAAPAIPTSPVPRSNILAGSGTGLPVICP